MDAWVGNSQGGQNKLWDKLCSVGALWVHCGHIAGTCIKDHLKEMEGGKSSNTCGCSNTTEQCDSEMAEIHIENAYRHTIGIVGHKVREMG